VGARPVPSPADGVQAGRPRVFGVEASARCLAQDGGAAPDIEIAVALLMTPDPDEEFVMRVPRGTFVTGALFVLSCPGLAHGALARTGSIAEPVGVHYDLVTALIMHPASDARASRPAPPRPITRTEPPSAPAVDVATDPRLLQLKIDPHGLELRQRVSATAVTIGGVATISEELSMTLLQPVRMGETVRLSVARGEVGRGVYFALRYFDMSGAKRGLIRADTLRPLPGMRDEVEGTLIRAPTQAEERQSYRAAFERLFTAEVVSRGGRRLHGSITDISAGGIGFRTPSELTQADCLRITEPSLPEIDGAELIVVRRGPRDSQCYGARFVEDDRGAAALLTVLGLDRAEREHRRRLQNEAARRSSQATASPLSPSDRRAVHSQRMRTRKRTRASGS
jgi:hypothetical protein